MEEKEKCMTVTYDFSKINEFLGKGSVVRRISHPVNEYVFLQIPSDIKSNIVPKMTSISKQVKDLILTTAGHIAYHDQAIKYNVITGAATYYNPTIEDCNAKDWIVVIA